MENVKRNVLLEKSYQFSLDVVKASYDLQDQHKEFVLSRQLIRSGTAVGTLSEEAQQGESKADFIHKLSIANKEAHETNYWLRLIRDSDRFNLDVSPLIEKSEELKKLLISIIRTSKSQ